MHMTDSETFALTGGFGSIRVSRHALFCALLTSQHQYLACKPDLHSLPTAVPQFGFGVIRPAQIAAWQN